MRSGKLGNAEGLLQHEDLIFHRDRQGREASEEGRDPLVPLVFEEPMVRWDRLDHQDPRGAPGHLGSRVHLE